MCCEVWWPQKGSPPGLPEVPPEKRLRWGLRAPCHRLRKRPVRADRSHRSAPCPPPSGPLLPWGRSGTSILHQPDQPAQPRLLRGGCGRTPRPEPHGATTSWNRSMGSPSQPCRLGGDGLSVSYLLPTTRGPGALGSSPTQLLKHTSGVNEATSLRELLPWARLCNGPERTLSARGACLAPTPRMWLAQHQASPLFPSASGVTAKQQHAPPPHPIWGCTRAHLIGWPL